MYIIAAFGNGNEWRCITKRGHGFDQHLIAKAKFREVQIDDGKHCSGEQSDGIVRKSAVTQGHGSTRPRVAMQW